MPILQVMGLSMMDPSAEVGLIRALAQEVASVSAMKVHPGLVTPFLLWSQIEPAQTDTIVVNFVGLLYRPERTLEVLRQVAEKVTQVLTYWMNEYPTFFRDQVKIEVIIDPLGKPKPDEYIYYSIVWVQPD